MSETLDNLRKARNLLDKVGWITGNLYEAGEGYCALGAVTGAKFNLAGADVADLTNTADPRSPYSDSAQDWPEIDALNKQLPPEEKRGDKLDSIWKFNDHVRGTPEGLVRRDKGEILDLFDRAIAALEEQ